VQRQRGKTHVKLLQYRAGSLNSMMTAKFFRPATVVALALFIVLPSLFRLVWQVNTPLNIWSAAGHDDGLFMRLAANISSGRWLGPYDQFTLAKGPGYPLFLALSAASGLPVTAMHALLAIGAILSVAWAIWRVSGSRSFAIAAFLLLIFLPVSFDPGLQRIFRDQIYWGQTLLFFSTFAVAMLAPPARTAPRLWLAAISGAILGWTWLTREEGVWLIPGIAIVLAGKALQCWLDKQPMRQTIIGAATVAAGFAAVYLSFLTANEIFYGRFIGVDSTERSFTAALSALESVDSGAMISHVPVSDEAMRLAAEVSPTFRPLAEALRPEGPLKLWRVSGCAIYSWTCGQVAGGWFIWALRDAGALNGFYASPAVASREFGKVADEIRQACDQGRLRCRARLIDLVPPITPEQWWKIPGAMVKVISLTSLLSVPSIGEPEPAPWDGAAAGDTAMFDRFWRFLNFPRAVPPMSKTAIISGWFYNKADSSEWPTLRVDGGATDDATIMVKRIASPDLVTAFHDSGATLNRFQVTYGCKSNCKLLATFSDGHKMAIALTPGRPANSAEGERTLYIDSVASQPHPSAGSDSRSAAARAITSAAFRIYNVLFPVALGLGLLCYASATIGAFRKRQCAPALIVATAAWALMLTRCVLIVLIDTISFPAIWMNYMAPAAYLAGVAAILSFCAIGSQNALSVAATKEHEVAPQPHHPRFINSE
jgi:hypothetical protein